MPLNQYLHVWKLRHQERKCWSCRKPIRLVIDTRGKYLPFDVGAQPIREDAPNERGLVLQVFEPSAFHRCQKLAQGKAIR